MPLDIWHLPSDCVYPEIVSKSSINKGQFLKKYLEFSCFNSNWVNHQGITEKQIWRMPHTKTEGCQSLKLRMKNPSRLDRGTGVRRSPVSQNTLHNLRSTTVKYSWEFRILRDALDTILNLPKKTRVRWCSKGSPQWLPGLIQGVVVAGQDLDARNLCRTVCTSFNLSQPQFHACELGAMTATSISEWSERMHVKRKLPVAVVVPENWCAWRQHLLLHPLDSSSFALFFIPVMGKVTAPSYSSFL